MAINLKDFIFHSDYTVNSLKDKFFDTVKTTAVSLGAGQNTIVYGTPRNIGSGRSVSIPTWIMPSLPQSNGAISTGSAAPGVIKKGGVAISTTQPTGQQPMGLWFFPFVAQDGQTVRAAIKIFNNTSGTLTIPARDWRFKVSTYNIPPKTT